MHKVKILKRSGNKTGGGAPVVEQKTLLRRPAPSGTSMGSGEPADTMTMERLEANLPEYQALLSTLGVITTEASADTEARMLEMIEEEREKLDQLFRARQEALLRLISSHINEYLPELIKSAIAEETAKVSEDVSALTVDFLQSSLKEAAEKSFDIAVQNSSESVQQQVGDTMSASLKEVASSSQMREAFAAAFKDVLLPSFEDSTRNFLASFSRSIGTEVERNVTSALRDGASGLSNDLVKLQEASTRMAETIVSGRSVGDKSQGATVDEGLVAISNVNSLLSSGNYADALVVATSTRDDALVESTVATILLEAPMPERSSDKLDVVQMTYVLHALAASSESHKSARLKWLADLSVVFVDASEEPNERNGLDQCWDMLKEAVEMTNAFQVDPAAKEDLRAKKLTVHLLNSQVRLLKGT